MTANPLLFQPLTLRDVTIRNRVMVSPMCQYSAVDGMPNDWHFVHLGRFAIGGAGIVCVEATGVTPEGRISWADLGLWNQAQQDGLARITAFLRAQGATPAIQLAHAGRKASTHQPLESRGSLTDATGVKAAWETIAPSPIAFDTLTAPRQMDRADMNAVRVAFAEAAKRADEAGFDIVELHGAHGYLLQSFLSPASNQRNDSYGGDREGRMRFPLEVAEAVRAAWPAGKPLFMRISSIDGDPHGWSLEDSIVYARELKARGIDAIDCSAGGATPFRSGLLDPTQPAYQTHFAEDIRRKAEIATVAVGRISDPLLAETILRQNRADIIAVGREMLVDPNWAQNAKARLAPESVGDAAWPPVVGYAVKALHALKEGRLP